MSVVVQTLKVTNNALSITDTENNCCATFDHIIGFAVSMTRRETVAREFVAATEPDGREASRAREYVEKSADQWHI